ncbi:50S ribosomal protein L37Ae [[Eubacterium] cellulosolvens]
MTRRTKKVGTSGRYGARYGVKLRRQISTLESRQKKKHICPECKYSSVKRASTGIWVCRHCGYTFTGGAYLPTTAVGESRMESLQYLAKETQSLNKKSDTKTKNKE